MEESKQSESSRPSIDHLVENNPFLGYVNSFERALEIVKEYELKTTTKFTVYKRSKNFGSAGKFTRVIRKLNFPRNLKTINKKTIL